MKKKIIPKVGIGLLAYNQGKYVDDAIESLRRQTYQDFEVFLIDDGSNDGFTREKLSKINYCKITKKYLHKDNIGAPRRRKQHDELMKNDYILNFCGDDILADTFLEKTVQFLEKHSQYGAVCTNLRLFKHEINDYYYEKKYDASTMKIPEMLIDCNMLGSSLIRKKALNDIDLSWSLTRRYDWNRWLAMLQKGWKLGLVPEPLFYYRQLEDSLSHKSNTAEDSKFMQELIKKYPKEFRDHYKEIIKLLWDRLIEVREGKNWLDKQYHNLNDEIKRLNEELYQCNKDKTESKPKKKGRIRCFFCKKANNKKGDKK